MTTLEQKFVLEYLVDQNGTRAYKAAGYKAGSDKSASVLAHRMLSKARIKKAIDAGLAKQIAAVQARTDAALEEACMSQEAFIKRLTDICQADLGDAFAVGPDGKLTMNIADMKKSGFSKLIRKMKVMPGGKVEIELHPVIPAMALLGKANGWVKDTIEHQGQIGRPDIPLGRDQFKQVFENDKEQAQLRSLALKILKPAGDPAKGD